jgi:hypothetical protein
LQQETERKFKELHGFGVNSCRFPGCTKCGHTLIDKPHSNKAKVKHNAKLQTKWKSDWGAVDNFLKGDGPPVVINGKNVTKIPNPTYESEILVCHCWKNCASKLVGGQKCAWNCVVDGMPMWASARSVFVLAPLSAAKSKCDGALLFVIHPSTHIPVP